MSRRRSTCLSVQGGTVLRFEADNRTLDVEHFLQPARHAFVEPLVGLDLDALDVGPVPE